MPRVDVPVTEITQEGVAPPAETTGDPVNNHQVVNNDRTWLEVRNSSATAARTVTVHISRTVDGQSVTPRTYSVAMGDTQRIKLGDPQIYGGLTQVDVDNAELMLRAWTLE